jgi:hypothetical protein
MKQFLLTTLIMIAGLFTLAAGARAETGTVVVHINEDFVAGGKTLPAGTYKVYQDSPGTSQTLILRGEKDSVFLIPSTHGQALYGQLKVKLRRVADVYYLSEVATDVGVYTFLAPRALTRTAKMKSQDLRPSSGAN